MFNNLNEHVHVVHQNQIKESTQKISKTINETKNLV